ncbi:hypothetical protein N9B25_01245 [bacterium]|nr:hypothetical protein [bacterium]
MKVVRLAESRRKAADAPLEADQLDFERQQVADTDEKIHRGNGQVSGFRISDDASQDVLLPKSAETKSAETKSAETKGQLVDGGASTESTAAAFGQLNQRASPDDSLLLCSQAVLERFVARGGLYKEPELRSSVTSPEAVVRAWVNNGSLRVGKVGESSLGGLYRVAFRSRLPSTSQNVVGAISLAAVETFDTGDGQKEQAKVWDSLTSGRMEIDATLGDLNHQLRELPVMPEALLHDDKVASPQSVRLDAMVSKFERLQLAEEGLQQNLRRAESLLAEGADRRLVLQALGAAPAQVKIASASQANEPKLITPAESEAQEAYRKWLEMRQNLIQKVELEVAPMQKKLDALIDKKYGPNHPAVSHLRGQIGRVRAQLANLPPQPDGLGMVLPVPAGIAQSAPATKKVDSELGSLSDGMSLVALLKAMRAEVRQVSEELERLDPLLESLSTVVASQETALRQRARIELEIRQQQSLRKAMIEHIEGTAELRRNSPEISCELVVPASSGVQVEPSLQSHLFAGSTLGGASGAVLFCLLLLSITAVAVEGEEEAE